MKLKELIIGQKIKFSSPHGDTTGIIVHIDESTVDVSPVGEIGILNEVIRITKHTILSAVETKTTIIEKVTPIEHPYKLQFEFVTTSASTHDVGSWNRPSNFLTQIGGFTEINGMFANGLKLPITMELCKISSHKKFKVTIEEI